MSEIKVNKISPRTACGTTTLGDSGDTFTIPAGVSITNNGTASGFGATGAVNWNTTVKTSTFTAVAGEGYFVNTTGGTITVNLPAGTAGAIVAVKDYAGTFDSNNLTISANGSDKIGGSTDNPILDTKGTAVTLVFVDSTQGWLVTDDGLQSAAEGPKFITATGGTVTTVCTNFKVHTFTSPGTFTVTCSGNAGGSTTVDYLVAAGGGGGGNFGGGGGGGGYRESPGAASGCYSVSPRGAAPAVALTVPATNYPITVGAGGAAGVCGGPQYKGGCGSNSIFSSITAAGGGGGGGNVPSSDVAHSGQPGGSGGGATDQNACGSVGSGNVPSTNPAQGSDGGTAGGSGGPNRAGGGGGATAVGGNGSGGAAAGAGGTGATSSINGTPTARAGGGGGGAGANDTGGAASPCGTGKPGAPSPPDKNAAANTSGGGGGGHNGPNRNGGSGGSGIVIIRYKFQ